MQAAVAYYRKDKERIDKGLPRPPKATPAASTEASADGTAAGQQTDLVLHEDHSQIGARSGPSGNGGEEDDEESDDEEEEEEEPHEVSATVATIAASNLLNFCCSCGWEVRRKLLTQGL